MAKTTPIILLLLSCSIALIFLIGISLYQQRLQQIAGLTNSTSTMCVNGKCVTTMCIENEPCHTTTSNSTTNFPNDSTKNGNNNIIMSPAQLRTA